MAGESVRFNALDLLSGDHVSGGYHCQDEIPLEGECVAWDVVRSYTGSLRQVDYHSVPWAMSLRIRIWGTSAADLEARKAALRAQCLAGGMLSFVNGGISYSHTIWPSTPPLVVADPNYFNLHTALALCTLTVCP